MIQLQEHPCLATWPEKTRRHHGDMNTGISHYCELDEGGHEKHVCPCGASQIAALNPPALEEL